MKPHEGPRLSCSLLIALWVTQALVPVLGYPAAVCGMNACLRACMCEPSSTALSVALKLIVCEPQGVFSAKLQSPLQVCPSWSLTLQPQGAR